MSMTDDTQAVSRELRHFWIPPAVALPFGTLVGAGLTVVQGAGLWMGYAIEENAGAPAFARAVIGDGANNAVGNAFGPYTFGPQQSRDDYWPGAGVAFFAGLSIVATTGSVAGSLWAVLMTRRELDLVIRTRGGRDR